MNHDIFIPLVITTDECLSIMETWESQADYWELKFRKAKYDKHDGYDRMTSIQVKCTDQDGLGAPVEGKWWLIDEQTVANGLTRIIEGGVANCRAELIQLLCDKSIDCVDIDQADAIVQAGLFGTLVYG